MRRLAPLFAALLGAFVLALLMASNPGYDRAFRPLTTFVPRGASGETRMFGARFEDWRTAARLVLPAGTRDTDGLFLIVDLTLAGTVESTMVRADWLGATGRRYAATLRAEGMPRGIDQLWLQPGLTSRGTAVFELPLDEINGGVLDLHLALDPSLEGALRLAPPAGVPPHVAVEEIGR